MASQPPVSTVAVGGDYVVGGIIGGSGNTVNNIYVKDATAAAQLANLRPAVTNGSAVEVVSLACPLTVCQVPFQGCRHEEKPDSWLLGVSVCVHVCVAASGHIAAGLVTGSGTACASAGGGCMGTLSLSARTVRVTVRAVCLV